jgi:AraC-like DNA-binding protein
MPSIPLPFVVALLLVIMLARLLRRDPRETTGWFVAMVAAYALQAVLLGLHWGYGLAAAQPVQAIMAAAIPPLSWAGFRGYVTRAPPAWWHAWPPCAVAAAWLLAPRLVDPLITLTFVAYGLALLRLGRAGGPTRSLDLTRAQGRHAGWIAGLASLAGIALLGWVAAIVGQSPPAASAPEPAASEEAAPEADADDTATVDALDRLMAERRLHRDPELSLERLARRMGLPARRISVAINRARGMNVSQYVNAHRVADACRMLVETGAPVTRILFRRGVPDEVQLQPRVPAHHRHEPERLAQAGRVGGGGMNPAAADPA